MGVRAADHGNIVEAIQLPIAVVATSASATDHGEIVQMIQLVRIMEQIVAIPVPQIKGSEC